MAKKICKLAKKGIDKEYEALCKDAKFLCKKCGRMANNTEHLCKVKDLEKEE